MLRVECSVQKGFIALCGAIILAFTGSVFGQTVTGDITGVIVDASGAVIPGAQVTLSDEGTGFVRQTKSAGGGVFTFVGLPPASYDITIAATGFAGYTRKGLVLVSSQQLALGNVALAVGDSSQTVTVTAEAASVNTESADENSLVSAAQLTDEVIKGRDWMNIVKILPGVNQTVGGSDSAGGQYGTASPNISGTRTYWNNLRLDGENASNVHIRGTFESTTSADAIAEVQVVTNTYLAQYGPNPGASINVITKSGTRDFHGTVYWFNRNEAYNANDFFSNPNGIRLQPYRFNNVGATFGGPVVIPHVFNPSRSKLFFFYSSEWWQSRIPATSITLYTVPTALERQGNFSQSYSSGALEVIKDPSTGAPFPGNVIPPSRINNNGQAMLNVLPMPNFINTAVSLGAYNFSFANYQNVPKLQNLLRLEYNPTGNDTITLRPKMWRADSESYTGVYGYNGPPLGSLDNYYYTLNDAHLAWTHIISPTLLNEFSGNFIGSKERGAPKLGLNEFNPFERQTYGITVGQFNPSINPYNFIPNMTFGGILNPPNINSDFRFPIDCGDEVFEFSNNLSKVLRNHDLKVGVYGQKIWSSKGLRATNFNGAFDFSNDPNNPGSAGTPFATALLGNFTSYSEATNKNVAKTTTELVEWFAQDVWKVNKKLTVSYGARFSWFTPYHIRDGYLNQAAAFVLSQYNPAENPVQYQPAIVAGTRVALNPLTGATLPSPYIGGFVPGTGNPIDGMVLASVNNGWRNQQPVQVAPKLAFAYDLFGDGKTAIRGGAGIYKRALEDMGDYMYTINQNPPSIYVPVQYYGNFNTFLNVGNTLFATNSVDSFDPKDKTPSVYSYSFSIQQALARNLSLEVAYVGNVGRHEMQQVNLNTVPYGDRFLPQNIDSTTGKVLSDAFLRPIVQYNSINYRENIGTSNYNSLQVKLNHRLRAGLQIGVAYTYSKAMDLTDNENGSLNPWISPNTYDRGPAGFDQTQVLSVNYIWDLPKASKLANNSVVHYLFDDWFFAGISTFASGTPSGVTLTTTNNEDLSGGSAGVRANIVGNPNSSNPTFNQRFNIAAVVLPPTGSYGNAAKDVFRGPGINNFDLTLNKNIPFGHSEAKGIRLRVEAYNAFNHTQFASVNSTAQFTPAGVQVNGAFGQVSATRTPRVMQMSLNVHF